MAAESAAVEDLAAAIAGGDRTALARGITLVESTRASDADDAQELVQRLVPRTGGAWRIGVSGMPGVGKSTFIDALGRRLLEQGHTVAVLAVDPSSAISGGSILGDKTRMGQLARDPRAYIRPSPSARTLGGVGRRTREALLLCEAAGFDVVLVETVGVGQSETLVADMVDCFLVLLMPGGGDELQGIKKGILEIADLLVVNKADGDNLARAREAVTEYSSALRYLRRDDAPWSPRVVMASGRTGEGLDEVWGLVREHRSRMQETGALDERRRQQLLRWMWGLVEERLLADLRQRLAAGGRLAEVEKAVLEGTMTPTRAAKRLLEA